MKKENLQKRGRCLLIGMVPQKFPTGSQLLITQSKHQSVVTLGSVPQPGAPMDGSVCFHRWGPCQSCPLLQLLCLCFHPNLLWQGSVQFRPSQKYKGRKQWKSEMHKKLSQGMRLQSKRSMGRADSDGNIWILFALQLNRNTPDLFLSSDRCHPVSPSHHGLFWFESHVTVTKGLYYRDNMGRNGGRGKYGGREEAIPIFSKLYHEKW